MKTHNYKRLSLPVLLFILALIEATGQNANVKLSHHSSDTVATHNMLVVGEKAVYLSHLPMFQDKNDTLIMPHRYQAILEVSFEKQGSNPQNVYMKDRQSHASTKIYTLTPEEFILPTIVSSNSQDKPRTKFSGAVVRGHLEKLQKGEGRILSGVTINIKKVVHFKEFDPLVKKPAQLEYLLFGKGQELFLAHIITTPPDFDQVLSVKITNRQFNDEELAKGIKVTFAGTINSSSARLKEKQQVVGEISTNNTSVPQKLVTVVAREFYFEEGELRIPAKFGTTPEESKGGFMK